MKRSFGLEGGTSAFAYLSQSGVSQIEGVNDAEDFQVRLLGIVALH
jgi:myosin heavy subunit